MNFKQIEKLKRELSNYDVKLIFTWRPLKKLMISSYQQYLKYGVKADLNEWLHSILDNPPDSKITPTFWKRHLHGDVLENWSDIFGATNITLIVVSDTDHSFIYRAFEQALKLKKETLQESGGILNRTLNAEEVEFLLEINRSFPRELGWNAYENSIRLGAIERLTSSEQRNPSGKKLVLPSWAIEQVERIEREQNLKIQHLGCSIVGDFEAAIISPVEFGEYVKPQTISIESASIALIGAGRQSLKLWRLRELIFEAVKRILRKIKYFRFP